MMLWTRIAILLAVELAVLALLVADKQWTLSTGTPVILQTEPVDPRSLFMGDYARLNYTISRLPLSGATALAGDKDFARHDSVWVALEPAPDGARAVSVHHDRDAIPPGLIALKGEVVNTDQRRPFHAGAPATRPDTLFVRYGIEHYFVEEGTGNQIERPSGGEKVSIRVAIDSRGKAGILAVLLDGREHYRETLF